MIREITPNDMPTLLELIKMSNMFEQDEIKKINEILIKHFTDNSKDLWFIHDNNELEGVVYAIPEPMTNGTWNILMLLVKETKQGQGCGTALIHHIEEVLLKRSARLVIIETSSAEDFDRARKFYTKCNYQKAAQIDNFYDTNNGKIIYYKNLK